MVPARYCCTAPLVRNYNTHDCLVTIQQLGKVPWGSPTRYFPGLCDAASAASLTWPITKAALGTASQVLQQICLQSPGRVGPGIRGHDVCDNSFPECFAIIHYLIRLRLGAYANLF